MRMRTPLAAALAIATAGGAGAAHGAVLRDPATGLRLTAPAGYTLSQQGGTYTLRGGGGFATFQIATSPLDARGSGRGLVQAAGGRVLRHKSVRGIWEASARVGGRNLFVRVRPLPGGRLEVAVMGAGAPVRVAAQKGENQGGLGISPRQVALFTALEAILATRRGGQVVGLNVPIPLRRVVTSENGASADIPALPGWQFDGANGNFQVFNPAFGSGTFGFSFAIDSGALGFPPVPSVVQSPFIPDPAVALATILPRQYVATGTPTALAFQDVQLIPGTAGALGPGFTSGYYTARLTVNGRPCVGIFSVGVTNSAVSFWQMYTSFVIVFDTTPSVIASALMRSWAGYTGEVGARRLTANVLENISNNTNPDFRRFDRDTQTWQRFVNGV
jgi:hypothetical protein